MRIFSRGSVAGALFLAIAAGCTAEVEDRGEAPEINVEGGRLPDIDVAPADITVTRDTQVVQVPQIEVEPRDP